MCDEHLEEQRDNAPYVTVKVGTVSAAGRAETLIQGFKHTCYATIRLQTSF